MLILDIKSDFTFENFKDFTIRKHETRTLENLEYFLKNSLLC